MSPSKINTLFATFMYWLYATGYQCSDFTHLPCLSGIGGFMVRQRKCHTRIKKGFFAQLAGETTLDGQPLERTIEEGG